MSENLAKIEKIWLAHYRAEAANLDEEVDFKAVAHAECVRYKTAIRRTILQRLEAQEEAPAKLAKFEARVKGEGTPSSAAKRLERQAEIEKERAGLEREIDAADNQLGRFKHHLEKMHKKAKVQGWGENVDKWPGDAPRSYYDICYYVEQFEKLAD